MAIEREIAEADVVHESDAGTQLSENVIGYLLLERGQLQLGQPAVQLRRRQRGGLGDRLAGYADRQRLGFEPRARTARTRLGQLILPQKHADVLLVALLFEPLKKGEDAEVPSAFIAEQELPVARWDFAPLRIEVDAAGACGLP